MAWSKKVSKERIIKFKAEAPIADFQITTLDNAYIEKRKKINLERIERGEAAQSLLFEVDGKSAILVDGAHVYVQMIDYSTAMLEDSKETVESHKRVLTMLHLNYTACDEVAEEFDAQRVDYHGPRMHAVILSPAGPENAKQRAEQALVFADAVVRAIKAVGESIEGGRYSTRVRVGIDIGQAVAVDSGISTEREPLFLGQPANYAAKLAEGDSEGIYISNRMRKILNIKELEALNILAAERSIKENYMLRSVNYQDTASYYSFKNAEFITKAAQKTEEKFRNDIGTSTKFSFHRHAPPLREIKFADLTPSNSIRMELTSIFADIDGFTNYIDMCIRENKISEAVANLYVIRKELAATLTHDFGGRKVRFIGDCIHGLLAEGSSIQTDGIASVETAINAAAGIRSSFELCQEELSGIGNLGIAIGIEYGTAPVTRLGIRGKKSVRCSIGRVVSASEEIQKSCSGTETALGPNAQELVPARIAILFKNNKASGLDVESLNQHQKSPVIIKNGATSATALPHCRIVLSD